MTTQKVDTVRCSHCQAQAKIVVQQIIEAHDLVMKSAFLQKRIHSVYCPQCNATLLAAVPTFYYDREKSLALIFVPADEGQGAMAPGQIRAQLIDSMRASLPLDHQDTALATPTLCSSLDAMVDAILEADGVDPQTLKTQAARAGLIETLMRSSSEAELKAQATAHADEIDATFFEILTAYMHTAQLQGDAAGAQAFLTVRTLLGQWLPNGARQIAAVDAKLGVSAIQSREQLFERLRNARNDRERAELVASGHFLIDQQFFALINSAVAQAVTIGDSVAVRQLKRLSAGIAELKRDQLARNQAALTNAANLFQAVVQSDTPDQVLQQRLDEVDEAFFIVLGANIERARRQGQNEPVRALELIGQLARSLQQQQVAP